MTNPRSPQSDSLPARPATPAIEALAFWVIEPNRGEIRPESLPDAVPEDALVRTLPGRRLPRLGPIRLLQRRYGAGRPRESGASGSVLPPPHPTRYRAPAGALHLRPDGVPPSRELFAGNLEIDVNPEPDREPRVNRIR